MTKKLYLIIFALCVTVFAAQAKDNSSAKKILDKTASTIKKSGDLEFQFTATSFKGSDQQGQMNGTLYLHGNAFHLVSDEAIYWFDGTTMWNYIKANNEVNVSNPPFTEQQAMNPYAILNLYHKGYEYEYGESTLRGKSCYCIHLRSIEKTQKIRELYLDIDKATYHPLCIRMRRGADGWTRISVQNIKTNQKYNKSTFVFNKENYPKAEIIDLR